MNTKLGKKSESPIFKQILDLIPHSSLRASINKYKTDKSCSAYFTYDELVSMMFGQLNKCLLLREISLGINQSPELIADIRLTQSLAKSTMSDGNTKRDYQVFEHLNLSLCKHFKSELSNVQNI
jgi:hypothetical protein